jgi:hypothetical protein
MIPRALHALDLRRQGRTLIAIAEELGVTKERARQLARFGLELERRANSSDPWDELGSRVRNALTRSGCEPTLAGVMEHLNQVDWRLIPSMGVKTYAELQAWLTKWKP